MKNILLCFEILVIGLLSVECKDENDGRMIAGAYVSTNVNLHIKDKFGKDLLDPNSARSFKKFKVHYATGTGKELYSNPMMDAPGGYTIEKFPSDSLYHLKVFLNSPSPESTDDQEWITYLEFEDGSTDTIAASFDVRGAYIAVKKASYNRRQVWDTSVDSGNMQIFEVIKP